MLLRSRGLLRLAAFVAAVSLISACDGGSRTRPLKQVDSIVIPEADTTTRTNFNIDDPTLEIPTTFPVSDLDLLTLVWSDEFDGTQLDPEVWFFESGDGSQYGIPGWGNNERQWYLPDNAQLEDGKLKITARRETVGNFGYTSARINTRDRFAFKYGRIEASIKLPSGQGLWPAFWMLAQDSPYGDWPASGEIDILEAVNLDGFPGPGDVGGDNEIFGTLHYGGGNLGRIIASTTYVPSTDVTADFHTYALEWDEFQIRWYYDGILYAVENSWRSSEAPYPAPFDQPFYVLLNLAVGGNFPGSPDGSTPFPATMEVDWVRVYSGEDSVVPPPDRDHGPGTAGLYTETTTESPIAITNIVNSIDYGGNNTVANPNSTAIPAFEGNVSMSIDYQNTGSTYGGVVLEYGELNLTAYDTLNFTINTSGIAGFTDMTIQIEPPGEGAAGTNVQLSAYTPVSTSGSWATYAIPLADFTVTDFSAAANLGFWNPVGGSGLVFGTLYVDDVYFSTEGDSGGGDHGPGTAGVFTETTTESTIPITNIVNSIDYSGNNTVADTAATPAFEGNVSMSIDYQNSGKTYGGVVLEFGGVDLTPYDTLNFTVDTSGIAGFLDMTIQIEPPGEGAAGTNVPLSNYTPVATSGNWETYAIPLADFTATDFSAVANLGFWNPFGALGLVFGTLYVDDIYFSTEGDNGGGEGNLAANGGFETGDFTGWEQFAGGGVQVVTGVNPSSGSFAANLGIPVLGAGGVAVDNLIKNANRGAGSLTPGAPVTVSFDMRGSLSGAGGVVFAELFSELAGEGVSKSEILGGGTLTPADAWTPYVFNTTLGPDVDGGVTLQLKVGCGPVEGCGADVYFDNVSIVVASD